ncbi:MAG TPA: hypothetical protein VEJ89_18580 [Myxococcaceae bacterium]|nr:hypothetical protein [Myxococcaceae bacterium]
MRALPTLVSGLLLVLDAGCRREEPPPLKSLAPAPLAPLRATSADPPGDREAAFRVEPAPVWGDAPPPAAVRVMLAGVQVRLLGASFPVDSDEGLKGVLARVARRPVLLVPDGETYLAQLAPLLAALDDTGAETWLLHPGGTVAFRLRLRDAPAFDAWLHEPKPGALRIVQRQDGLELVSNVGKLPGGDANGPTVPRRGGQLDVALARTGLVRLKGRFAEADALCVVPSYGTEVRETAALLAAAWAGPREPLFQVLCLVYPRPAGWRPVRLPG